MELHLSTDLDTKLASLAGREGRDRHSLVTEAIERMVDHDGWFIAEVEKGLAQVEAGKTLSHEEAGTRLEMLLARKQPSS